MKTSVILIIVAFIMILKGFGEPVNEKYIITGILIGIVGWMIILFQNGKDDRGDDGKSLRSNKTWEDNDVR